MEKDIFNNFEKEKIIYRFLNKILYI